MTGPVALTDSRRLTGPTLLLDVPGALLDVHLPDAVADDLIREWEVNAQRMLRAVGWSRERTASRRYGGGASLALTAPIDALYAATELNEWAWAAVDARYRGEREPDFDEAAARLQGTITAERNPALVNLRDEADRRGVTFLSDDDLASVGMGTGSRTWPVAELPVPGDVPWGEVYDVPVALITGCNGKTTTVRLLAAMALAADRRAGYCCTDGLFVDGVCVDAGDWSGPGGARAILRDTRVEVALLETARGGLLRRGLMIPRADAALVTNVAADHLGEYGVTSVDAIAETKLLVARAVRHGAPLVVNADDPVLARHVDHLPVAKTWFGFEDTSGAGDACFVGDGEFVLRHGDTCARYGTVDAAPLTLGGAARFNVYNILGAIPVARALGIGDDAIRRAIREFDSTPETNPGRGHLFELGGVRIFVDFVHNPHGMTAVAEMVRAMPASRRLVALGQAGDRDDASIRELVEAACALRPDRVLVKEMREYLRGRKEGEVADLIVEMLLGLGIPKERIGRAADELDAVRQALAWARAGDLVILPVHTAREAVIEAVRAHQAEGGPRPD